VNRTTKDCIYCTAGGACNTPDSAGKFHCYNNGYDYLSDWDFCYDENTNSDCDAINNGVYWRVGRGRKITYT